MATSILDASALTPVQQAEQNIRDQVKTLFNTNLSSVQQLYNYLWLNPDQDNCAPNQLLAQLGTSAAQLLGALSNLGTNLNGFQSGCISTAVPAGWTITAVGDGSVTATYVAPSGP